MTKKIRPQSKRGTKAKLVATERGANSKGENPEIRRAAERAKLSVSPSLERKEEANAGTPDPYEAAMRHVTSRFGEALIRACDQLGQELARAAEWQAWGKGAFDADNIMEALLTLWQLRWELGLTPCHVSVDAASPDQLIRSALERSAKSETNGAAANGGAS